jgi:hypothetical protein
MEAGYWHAREEEDGKWVLSNFFYEPIETYASAQEILEIALKDNRSIKFSTLKAIAGERAYVAQFQGEYV